jgi:hypothetical protein
VLWVLCKTPLLMSGCFQVPPEALRWSAAPLASVPFPRVIVCQLAVPIRVQVLLHLCRGALQAIRMLVKDGWLLTGHDYEFVAGTNRPQLRFRTQNLSIFL